MKNRFILLFFFLSCFYQSRAMDEFGEFDAFLDDVAADIGDISHAPMVLRYDPKDTLETIVTLGAQNLVKSPLYFYTKPLRIRTLFDLEFYQDPYFFFDNIITAYPFFTITPQVQFNKSSTAIASYIDMEQQELVGVFEKLEDATFPLPDVLEIFSLLKGQQWQTGFMFQYSTFWNDWDIRIRTPFFYQLFNFYLTPAERALLEPYLPVYGQDAKQFAFQHLLSDKMGFGDTRIYLEKFVITTPHSFLSCGFDMTIPTNWALVKGLVGNHFSPKQGNPDINIAEDILEPAFSGDFNTALTTGVQLSEAAIDRLSAILLEYPLGNYRHVSLGFFSRGQIHFSPEWRINSKTRFELTLPGSEYRFFKQRINPNDIDAIAASVNDPGFDDTIAQAGLDLLGDLFIEQFFPCSYRTTVFPGFSLQNTSFFARETPRWIFSAGANLWYQSPEIIGTINTSPDILQTLDVGAGTLGYAVQARVWLGFQTNRAEGNFAQWGVTLCAPLFAFGIGNEFALTVTCSYDY